MKLIGTTCGAVKNTETGKNFMLGNLETKEQNELKRQENKLIK